MNYHNNKDVIIRIILQYTLECNRSLESKFLHCDIIAMKIFQVKVFYILRAGL